MPIQTQIVMHLQDQLRFIPDATITGDTVSGTRGALDVADIYFQTGGYDTTGNGMFTLIQQVSKLVLLALLLV